MFRHLLPNAMVATMTFLPFILSSSVMTLTALDFLGFGLPPGSPSLGELLSQGKTNIQAPWLGLAGFFSVAIMLSLLIFIGEAVRDAFDPQKDVPVSSMDMSADPLLSVKDLSVAFRQGERETLAVDRISFDISKGETRRAGRRIRLGQVGDRAVGDEAPALSGGEPSLRHASRSRAASCSACREREIREVRGDDITIIFQEPMTSLNPLHTIERQIGEILLLHRGLTGAARRARASSNC